MYLIIALIIACTVYSVVQLIEFRQYATEKYVICMPEGGLCDMMARIHDCIEYCKKYNRILLLDTSKATHARDYIETYFTIDSSYIYKGDLDVKYESLKGKPFYPPELADTFLTMEVKWTKERSIIDLATKVPTYFDLTKPYSEDVLLFRDCGGGAKKTLGFLSLCKVTPLVKQVYEQRRAKLPEQYIAVHVRNTDRKSDVDGFIKEHHVVFKSNPIFLATDDHATIDTFKELYGSRVYSFANITSKGSEIGIHHVRQTPEENRQSTIDAIVDLVLLANGKILYYSHTTSGFSKVAEALQTNTIVLHHLLK